jgi:outer membrane protein assembly factor BamB
MMNSSDLIKKSLQYIAVFAAIFAMILCMLIIVNYIQIKRTDPLNTPALKVLVEQLHSGPGDDQLRQQIRELDLVARKAFFTNQWQVRMGGYLLFFSLLVLVICLKAIEMQTKKLPAEPSTERADFWHTRKLNRIWVIYTGVTLVAVSLLLVFLTNRDLGKNFEAAGGNIGKIVGANNAGNANNKDIAGNAGMQENSSADSAGKSDTAAVNMDGYPTAKEIAGNFASFRGVGGNGIAFQKNIPVSWDGRSGKNIRWKTEIPLSGYNSPIIWNDRIFLTGANETRREVYCFDLNTGKIQWKVPVEKIPGSPSQAPSVNRETGQSAPTMTTDGRRVYAIFANGDLIALDFAGNKIWSKNLGVPANHYGHSSSLIMYHDLLIVQYDQRGSGSIMAFSGKTGEIAWKTSRNVKVSWASPVIVYTGKRTELILAAEPMVASYNPANGKELWNMECISGEVGPSVAYADGVVFSVNDYSKLAAVAIGETPALLWEDNEYLSDIPSPVATGKFLFLPITYGTVVCYDARTGTKHWVHEFDNPIYASPILAEGKVYLMDKKGIMHIIKTDEKFTLVGEPQLGEGSVCTPAFADGKIIIRGDKNLYCVGK